MDNATQKNQYVPDYLVTPGEVLEDYLDDLGMTQLELAARTGLTKKTINEIIHAKSPITPETALKFERALGRPAHFWNNLEQRYQEDRIRLAEKQKLESSLHWLDKVPVKSMIKLKWVREVKDKIAQLQEVLRFYGVTSPEQWEKVWLEYQVAYRQTKRFMVQPEAVSAWLRRGEILARETQCDSFDRKRFLEVLQEIRSLTRENPAVFEPHLKRLCASAGVAVVFVPEIPNTGISGATRWLADKALIQLSLRYKSNDHLWFTFFHEAGHILKHGRKEVFLETNGLDNKKEEEANSFARDSLIPPKQYRELVRNDRPTLRKVQQFAEKINIAPGIVIGRLQHDAIISRNVGNYLKVFYRWGNEADACIDL